MRLAVYKPGYPTPLYVGETIDDCLEWIGDQIGCNWATKLETVARADDSYNVIDKGFAVATRAGLPLDYTIGPVY